MICWQQARSPGPVVEQNADAGKAFKAIIAYFLATRGQQKQVLNTTLTFDGEICTQLHTHPIKSNIHSPFSSVFGLHQYLMEILA